MIWTHLSNQILSNQSSFGKDDPGRIKRIDVTISQIMGGKNEYRNKK